MTSNRGIMVADGGGVEPLVPVRIFGDINPFSGTGHAPSNGERRQSQASLRVQPDHMRPVRYALSVLAGWAFPSTSAQCRSVALRGC